MHEIMLYFKLACSVSSTVGPLCSSRDVISTTVECIRFNGI